MVQLRISVIIQVYTEKDRGRNTGSRQIWNAYSLERKENSHIQSFRLSYDWEIRIIKESLVLWTERIGRFLGARPNHERFQPVKLQCHLRERAWTEWYWLRGFPASKQPPRKVLFQFSLEHTWRPLKPWTRRARMHLQVAADLGSIACVALVLH